VTPRLSGKRWLRSNHREPGGDRKDSRPVGTMQTEPRHRRRIALRNGRPAHEAFKGRVTLSDIARHGSYQAAREALEG